MLCVVMKPFVSNRVDFVRDQLVEGGEFRNVEVLLSQRYIRHATSDEIQSARFEGDEPEEEVVETAPQPKKKLKAVIRRKPRMRAKARR